MEENQNTEPLIGKFVWKKSYTWLLLINACYIVLFYYLMKSFA